MIREVTGTDWSVVQRLWQLYIHDLSEFRGTLPDATGSFAFLKERLGSYVEDTTGDQVGYLVRKDEHAVGFALVRGVRKGPRMMAHFFTVRGVRRTGVGRDLALDVIGRRPDRWEIVFQEQNTGAARFWRGVADTAFGDDWHEELRPVPGMPDLPGDVWILAPDRR